MAELTAQDWLDQLLVQSPEVRLRIAEAALAAIANQERGAACEWEDHNATISEMSRMRQVLRESLEDVRKSANELGPAGQGAARGIVYRLSLEQGWSDFRER